MKKLAYGVVSGLLILTTTIPVGAKTPASAIAQSNSSNLERMYQEQRVLSDEIQTLMAEMKTMMAEMKALTTVPEGQTPTMADLYKQQQVLMARTDILLNRTRFETILPQKSTAKVQEVHQQQMAMLTELKTMMAEMKKAIEVYRGRATGFR